MTPDSFSDGGKFNNGAKSFKHIAKMIKDGASIIDIGGDQQDLVQKQLIKTLNG